MQRHQLLKPFASLPLLYSAGLAFPEEEITYPHDEISFGSLSMRTVQVG